METSADLSEKAGLADALTFDMFLNPQVWDDNCDQLLRSNSLKGSEVPEAVEAMINIEASQRDGLYDVPPAESPIRSFLDECHNSNDKPQPPELEVTAELSDNSWTSEDNREEWQFAFEAKLGQFIQDTNSLSLITELFPSKQRNQVHALAHLKKLSHTSLGSGKLKRVLLVKRTLYTANARRKRWNPGHIDTDDGFIDPHILAFYDVSSTDMANLTATCGLFLCLKGLPTPASVEVVLDQTSPYVVCIRALFDDPSDTALVVQNLRYGGADDQSFRFAKCDYNVFRPAAWTVPSAADRLKSHFSIPMSIVFSSTREPSEGKAIADNILSRERPNPSATSRPIEVPRRTSSHANGEYTSVGSFGGREPLCLSDYGSEVSLSKRKRLPYSEGAYECSFGCGKTFDFAGERTKHERIHQTDRPYCCKECGHGFMYPKDLRRHGRNTRHAIETSHTGEEQLQMQSAEDRSINTNPSESSMKPIPSSLNKPLTLTDANHNLYNSPSISSMRSPSDSESLSGSLRSRGSSIFATMHGGFEPDALWRALPLLSAPLELTPEDQMEYPMEFSISPLSECDMAVLDEDLKFDLW